jgi:hypothetical protein
LWAVEACSFFQRRIGPQVQILSQPEDVQTIDSTLLCLESTTLRLLGARWCSCGAAPVIPCAVSSNDPGLAWKSLCRTPFPALWVLTPEAAWTHLEFGIPDQLTSGWWSCQRHPKAAILVFATDGLTAAQLRSRNCRHGPPTICPAIFSLKYLKWFAWFQSVFHPLTRFQRQTHGH